MKCFAGRILASLVSTLLLVGVGVNEAQAREASDGDALTHRAERGPVAVELVVRPAAPVIGDVLELELTVTAEPGVELLMPEFGEALGRFEIVDFAPSERLDQDGRTVARQRYRLQPARSGPQSIPPLRVEFVDRRSGQTPAPDGEDAYEILTDRIPIEVASVLPEEVPLALSPAHADLSARSTTLLPPWAWVVIALVSLAVVGPFAWRAWGAARARQRQRSAYEIARGALDALLALGRPDAAGLDAFYVELSLIVRSYLEDRFGLRSPELTTQEFLTVMGRSPDLARSHQQLLRGFLTRADLVKFAGHRPDAEAVAESIGSAERFLEETRTQVRSEALGAGPAAEVGRA